MNVRPQNSLPTETMLFLKVLFVKNFLEMKIIS